MPSNWMDLISKVGNSKSQRNVSISPVWPYGEAVVAEEEAVVEAAIMVVDAVADEDHRGAEDIGVVFVDEVEVVFGDVEAEDIIRTIEIGESHSYQPGKH